MTLQLQDLTEIVPLAVLWDEVFDQAKREQSVEALLNELKNLPPNDTIKVRMFQCRWHLACEQDLKREKRLIIHEIAQMKHSLLARGYHLAFVVESTSSEDLTRLIRKYTNERKKFPMARTMEDLEGLGRYALCLAGSHVSVGNEKGASEELEEVKRFYGPMGHKGMNVRLKFQELRLHFVSGKHHTVHQEAGDFILEAAKVNAALCGCAVDYLFYSDLLIGKRKNKVHPNVCFNLFYDTDVSIPTKIRTTFNTPVRPQFIQVLTAYQKTVQLVDGLHQHFPVFRRETKKFQKLRHELIQDIEQIAGNLVAEEFGEFMVSLCLGIARACIGDRSGLTALNNINPPVMRKSLVLGLMRASCLLEAKMLMPYEPVTLEMTQSKQLLKRIPQLDGPTQRFLLHWMCNLCPHVLQLYHTLHQDEKALEMLQGVLVIGEDDCKVHQKPDIQVVNYPKKLMSEDVVSIMSGDHLGHAEYVRARHHTWFMLDHGLRRAVFTSLITEFLDREPEVPGNAI